MHVELFDYTRDPETAIANAAAVCYGSLVTPEANRMRIMKLMQMGHLSPLRFAYASFRIHGVSRVESHQHVRVAHAGILQESRRYVAGGVDMVYPRSFAAISDHVLTVLDTALKAVDKAYTTLLEAGVPAEDARYIVPQGTSTTFVMTGNFQMWHGWLKARDSKHAQWEIREVASRIHGLLHDLAPNIFPLGYADGAHQEAVITNR